MRSILFVLFCLVSAGAADAQCTLVNGRLFCPNARSQAAAPLRAAAPVYYVVAQPVQAYEVPAAAPTVTRTVTTTTEKRERFRLGAKPVRSLLRRIFNCGG